MLAGKPLPLALVLIAAAAGCQRGDKKPPPAAAAPPEATAAPSAAASATAAAPSTSGSAGAAGRIPGQVRMGAAQVSGKLRGDVVNRVVRKHFAPVKACYQAALAKDPAIGGRLVVKFTIDHMGLVTESGPGHTDVRDTGLVECVAGVFKTMTFPQPDEGEVHVAFPIVFAPAQ